jgi:adenylate cyclase
MPDSDELARALEVAQVRALVDDLVEASLRERESLAAAQARILPALAERLGARAFFLSTYGEDNTLELFLWPEAASFPGLEEALAKTGPGGGPLALAKDGGLVLARPLDVAGEWFGAAGLAAPGLSEDAAPRLSALLEAGCEALDHFLYGLYAARERHRVMMALADALRHRVLEAGLSRAAGILARATPLDRLLIALAAEGDAPPQVLLFEGARLALDTLSPGAPPPLAAAVTREAKDYLAGRSRALLARFGLAAGREEALINGVARQEVVGRLAAASAKGPLGTYDRELLAGFAGFIRQRVVDFGRERRRLSSSFRPGDVARLLREEDYEPRFLAPREAEVAILYADISGFTRVSERLLRSPSAVAALVEGWSREAVRLLWANGGAFDKMVGDCVIGLFGPPFYDEPPGEQLLRAIHTAKALREMTREFPSRPGLDALRQEGLGVAIGVNLAPLFVGYFGPNTNFTGFSSGMNNTARLQGCARRDEILVMAEALARLPAGHDLAFGAERAAPVKNVAAPLRFRGVL